MRPRVILVFALTAIVLGSAMLVPAAYSRLAGATDTTAVGRVAAAPPAPRTLAPAPVALPGEGFAAWALLDRSTGQISGSPNISATNSTESMIKIWIVADHLRRLGSTKPSAEDLARASAAIRDSDDIAAENLYRRNGREAVISRMIQMCKLTDTKPVVPPGRSTVWWSYTRISARDAVRLGECVKNGTAAGPTWTRWVLDEMTKVRGTTAPSDQKAKRGGGRWGIIDGLPAEIASRGPIGIKNGWTLIGADGQWHLNCLAVADAWVLAVLLRYDGERGLDYGANVCANVTVQLVTPGPGAAVRAPVPIGKKPIPTSSLPPAPASAPGTPTSSAGTR